MKKYVVDLNEQEKKRLEDLITKGKSGARKIRRAHILLLAEEGYIDEEIARVLAPGVRARDALGPRTPGRRARIRHTSPRHDGRADAARRLYGKNGFREARRAPLGASSACFTRRIFARRSSRASPAERVRRNENRVPIVLYFVIQERTFWRRRWRPRSA